MWKWIHCALAAAAALAAAQAFCQVPAAPSTDFSQAEEAVRASSVKVATARVEKAGIALPR